LKKSREFPSAGLAGLLATTAAALDWEGHSHGSIHGIVSRFRKNAKQLLTQMNSDFRIHAEIEREQKRIIVALTAGFFFKSESIPKSADICVSSSFCTMNGAMIDITRRRLPYVLMDVFTDRPLEGNQLAIYTDARGLSTEQMQSIAREMNLSETTFIFPREIEDERRQGTRVRIFTTQEELPFAGHPTLGTAYFLHRFGGTDEIWLDLNVGKIPVTFRRDGNSGRSFGEMRQRDPEAGQMHSKEDIARATGLSLNEIAADLPVQTFSTGMPFVIVPVTSLAAIRKAGPWSRMAEYLERADGKFFYLVTQETVAQDAKLHARMPFYNGDDPATGSAAGCCASWMAMHGVIERGQQAIIEQGLEVHRPSRIYVRAEKSGDKVVNVHVGGYCVEVAQAELWV
jgi:trans-2,3-dihydro-3-hydroxyanthranilate isomerase